MKCLVCFLEERSAKVMLEEVLSRLLPSDVTFQCIAFDGKQDLEKQLVRKLKGWNRPNSVFLVMRDQDQSNCMDVKIRLQGLCQEAGKPETLVRIACQELESFYFGDLSAVAKGLDLPDIERYKTKRLYRDPDQIINPGDELKKLTGKLTSNKNVYSKVLGSRSIAPHLSLDGSTNTSNSFNVLLSGIIKLVGFET